MERYRHAECWRRRTAEVVSMAHRPFLGLLLAAAVIAPGAASAWAEVPAPVAAPPAKIQPDARRREIFIAMRDGVRLAANLFLPAGDGPWPVIVTRTPYLKDGPIYPPAAAERFTRAGYAYVVQDVRGKGRSEGAYNLFATSIEDGYDTIEALAGQSWSNGEIGITGGSAMGINAEMAALGQPPHLKAAFVLFPGGVPKGGDLTDFFHRSGLSDELTKTFETRGVDNVILRRWALGEDIDLVRIPIWHLGGWYDIFSAGTLSSYRYLQDEGAPGARSRQRLTMGPFGHGPESGDLAYPGEDLMDEVIAPGSGPGRDIRWFDHWLKGADNGVTREPPVEVFMMASARKGQLSPKNRWLHFDRWPAPHTSVRYFLAPGFSLSPSPPGAPVSTATYSFDPSHPVRTYGGANLFGERGPEDQRAVGERQDYLRFSTPVLTRDVAIVGDVEVELFAGTDAPSTDFEAKLVDVYPDGYEALVLDSPIRVRANSLAPQRVVIDLQSTAITFEKGHRIALHITSSNSPRFEVNHNNGDTPLAPAPPRVARNTLYLDRTHPSALVLPVIDGAID